MTETPTRRAGWQLPPWLDDSGRELALVLACIVAIAVFSMASPFFLTASNLMTILRNSYELLLVGLAMTLLIAMGAVDISIGAAMGFCALFVGYALLAGLPLIVAILVGCLSGAAAGLVVALVVVGAGIPSIVGTLGLMGVIRMAIYLLLGGQWMSGIPDGLTRMLAAAPGGLPVAVWVIAIVYLAVWVALRRTGFGLHILAIGNSEAKARLQGLPVLRLRFITHVVSGVLTGIAAVYYVATYRNVTMAVGSDIGLEAIAAVILGGSAITGGKCSIIGTALGVALLRILQNGLLLIGVPSLWQTVVTGALLLGVLAAEVGSGSLRGLVRERGAA
ncbi:ABC transporter permease [Acidimangrovimonas sediminis]|uniref:ABC transporter permease n=1 Tax=Acidimangrovimonas sediminis TaxID=2056283 RepID=UPI000C8048F3|nr:ABC transporter permease [Acidimangrovimonas sediminis]